MPRLIRFAAFASLLVAGHAVAGARADLQAFSHDLKGLQGQFSQQVLDSTGKLKEESSGTVALSAPRQFRWEYQRPYQQVIVADGSKVWVYDPDLQQVTVRPQGEEEQNSPLTALIDPSKLDVQYDVSEEAAPRDGLEWLSLTPKVDTEASFQIASLGFNGNMLVRMEVTDTLGQHTRISFTNLKRNPGLPASTC